MSLMEDAAIVLRWVRVRPLKSPRCPRRALSQPGPLAAQEPGPVPQRVRVKRARLGVRLRPRRMTPFYPLTSRLIV